MDSFRRHGAELDAAGKKRLSEIDVELTIITTKFGENTLDATNAWELVIEDEAKLAGLAAFRSRRGARFAPLKKAATDTASPCKGPATSP